MQRPSDSDLAVAAAHLCVPMLEKDPAVAETLALIEGVADSYELAALHYFRVYRALQRRAAEEAQEGPG